MVSCMQMVSCMLARCVGARRHFNAHLPPTTTATVWPNRGLVSKGAGTEPDSSAPRPGYSMVLALALALALALLAGSRSAEALPQLPQCSLHPHRNCYHFDLGNDQPAASPEECCARCSSTTGCKAFTFDTAHNNHCYLKTSCAGVAGDSSATSGVLNASDWPAYNGSDRGVQLPRLNVASGRVMSNGHSSGGDMAVQFHVAFSSEVGSVCGFDAQPYHCAGTRFPGDNLMPQSAESSVPYCEACPPNKTLVYGPTTLRSLPPCYRSAAGIYTATDVYLVRLTRSS